MKHIGADIHDPKARTSTTLRDFQKLRCQINFGLNFRSLNALGAAILIVHNRVAGVANLSRLAALRTSIVDRLAPPWREEDLSGLSSWMLMVRTLPPSLPLPRPFQISFEPEEAVIENKILKEIERDIENGRSKREEKRERGRDRETERG